jgi:hypothetical protein
MDIQENKRIGEAAMGRALGDPTTPSFSLEALANVSAPARAKTSA